MKTLFVNEKYNGKKLNRYLLDNFPSLSTSLFYKTLRKKDIKVNGKRVNENVNVFAGDKVDIYIDDCYLLNTPKIDIVYEDDNIILVNKPINMEVTGENSLSRNFMLRI